MNGLHIRFYELGRFFQPNILQVLRAFGIPQENICISLVLVASF